MPFYRKKPVVIEARRFVVDTEEAAGNLANWCGGVLRGVSLHRMEWEIAIPTDEGTMTASFGDWIIKGVKGEFYPCKPHIFELTYEDA